MNDITREELAEILADVKQMWSALCDVAIQVPGAAAFVAPRNKLPPVIDMVFAQAGAVRPEARRNEIIEEVAKNIEAAPLTYTGPDPHVVSDLRYLIVCAIRDLKTPASPREPR